MLKGRLIMLKGRLIMLKRPPTLMANFEGQWRLRHARLEDMNIWQMCVFLIEMLKILFLEIGLLRGRERKCSLLQLILVNHVFRIDMWGTVIPPIQRRSLITKPRKNKKKGPKIKSESPIKINRKDLFVYVLL